MGNATVNVFVHIKLKKYLEKAGKRSYFVPEKSRKPVRFLNEAYIECIVCISAL